MSKKTISLISSLLGLFIFLILAFGSSEDENSGEENQIVNSVYTTTSSDKQEYNANNEKELSIKKEIVSVEKQKQLVKSFIKQIEFIEKPATQSNKNFLEILDYYQQGFATSSDVIQSAKSTKKQCENAMFSMSDLKVPDNLPNEIESLLKGAKKDLIISWSIKGTTLNNITGYFKDGNPKRIDYFNNDVSEARDYVISAFVKISKVYEKLGMLKEYNTQKTSEVDQRSKKKSNDYGNENNNSLNKSQIKSGTENIKSKTESINDMENKTDRQKRKEERKRKKEDRKKNKKK